LVFFPELPSASAFSVSVEGRRFPQRQHFRRLALRRELLQRLFHLFLPLVASAGSMWLRVFRFLFPADACLEESAV